MKLNLNKFAALTFHTVIIMTAGSGAAVASSDVIGEKISRKIEHVWTYKGSDKIQASFLLQSNGQIKDLKLLESSKDSVLNKRALSAISASTPFPCDKSDMRQCIYTFGRNPSLVRFRSFEIDGKVIPHGQLECTPRLKPQARLIR